MSILRFYQKRVNFTNLVDFTEVPVDFTGDPSLPVLSFTETDELNWNCELADWFWSFTELS